MKPAMQTSSNSSSSVPDGPDVLDSRWLQAQEEEIEEEEEAPTHLNTNIALHFLVISTDKLSARYIGEGRHGNDVGAIQGNRPAPFKKLLYYFEIDIKDRGQRGVISIGFTDDNFKTSRQVGWEPNSYGYHGDDGKLYAGRGRGTNFGPTFTTGDTIGAGINYATQEIFFTKNGKLVGPCSKEVKGPLYPSIGLHSPNERVDVNFGQRSFVFDVEVTSAKALAREDREKRQRAIENIVLPLTVSHSIVRAYLIHYGYQDTLIAFDAASGNATPSLPLENGNKTVDDDSYALDRRKILRQLTRNGDIDGVFSRLAEWYPQLLQDATSTVSFLLHCQKFIELIKNGFLEMAVSYARSELSNYYETSTIANKYPLQDCIALLAYEQPEESCVGYLLKMGWRETVADVVNSAILSTNPALLPKMKSLPQSSLERLLRQLAACCTEKRLLTGGQGENFRLRRLLQGNKDGAI